MLTERRCGILCHPTSMPSPYGIGDLGQGAENFIEFLVEAGQTLWQVLPLGPTGYGDSPYQSFSAFAGNPLLIDLEQLVEEGLLPKEEISPPPTFPEERVDYGAVIAFKHRVLRRSYENLSGPLQEEKAAFEEAQRFWLEDYALFMALKEHFGGDPWIKWPSDIALRQPDALAHWRQALAREMDYHRYLQFLFERQWQRIKAKANAKGIAIIGDVPIFVGHDSADVWSHRELFYLDEKGSPTVVAGVPPDYFSPTGQLWGNPLYRWDVLAREDYSWWLARLRRVLSQVDIIRLDHFRGFAGYWEIPAEAKTAIEGRWVKGPGKDFFLAVKEALGSLPIIAEDLGLITPDVIALRDAFDLPGMKVLQFAFDTDGTNAALPHNHVPNCVVYTGTHDNDTTVGWYHSRDELTQHKVRLYTGTDGRDIHWTFIRLAMTSVARMAIYPLQDVLGLGSEARLNFPGKPSGNWCWRYRQEQLTPELAQALRDLALITGRWIEPGAKKEAAPEPIEYESP
ncbi:MAG: 4-alpha-glucanotransferase [Anaerolineae bacterium]|nr:4-alpha-glucanotransferase [Anaerolineae bacterium]